MTVQGDHLYCPRCDRTVSCLISSYYCICKSYRFTLMILISFASLTGPTLERLLLQGTLKLLHCLATSNVILNKEHHIFCSDSESSTTALSPGHRFRQLVCLTHHCHPGAEKVRQRWEKKGRASHERALAARDVKE